MRPKASLPVRWSRAVCLSSVAMVSGVVAHVAAGGLVPGRAALLVLFCVCAATAASLLGRPASTLRVVVLVMAGQTFIHGALTAMSGHEGDPPLTRALPASTPAPAVPLPTGDGRRVGSLYDQVYGNQPSLTQQPLTIPAPLQHLLADLTGPHAVMACAHLAAAAVLGLWLAVGERALWTVLALMADRACAALGRSVLAHYGALSAAWVIAACLARRALALVAKEFPCPSPRTLALSRCVVRRGPPDLLAA